ETDGVTCGDRTCAFTTPCGGFGSQCAETGTRNRRCIERTCDDEACVETAIDTSAACTRNTGATVCGRIIDFECIGDDGLCPDGCEGACVPSDCTEVTCSGGMCPSLDAASCPGGD